MPSAQGAEPGPAIERCEACGVPIVRDPAQARRCAGCSRPDLAAAVRRVVQVARAERPAQQAAPASARCRTGGP